MWAIMGAVRLTLINNFNNRQNTGILFRYVSLVHSAQNLIELTPVLVVGVSKRRD